MGEDLLDLEHLEGLEGWCTSHVSSFNQYVESQCYQQLLYYDFVVGSGRFIRFLHELANDKLNILERNVRIFNSNIGGSREVIMLPLNMQYLQIQQCEFSSETLLDALPSLNDLTTMIRLWIGRCRGLNFILPAASSSSFSAAQHDSPGKIAGAATPFQGPKELILWDLPEIKGLVEEGFILPPGAFSNLKKVSIKCCSKIKSLSSFSLHHLHILEELNIEECIVLEELIVPTASKIEADTKNEEEVIKGNIFTRFPNLKVLKLLYLPKLLSICSSGLLQCDKIAEIEISLCSKLQSLPLSLCLSTDQEPCPFPYLQEIKVDRWWWELLDWHDPQLKNVLQPFVQFQKLCGSDYQLLPAISDH